MDNKFLLSDLVQSLADKGYPLKDADAFARCFFQQLEKNVLAGESVRINRLGTFRLQKVEARKSVDVNTGDQIEIEGHYKFSFIPDQDLKNAVNKPYSHLDNVDVDAPSSSPLFTVYDSEAQESYEAEKPVSADDAEPVVKPRHPAIVFKITVTCLLLAVIVYMFIHSESFGVRYTDAPQITVVTTTGKVNSQLQDTLAVEETASETVEETASETVEVAASEAVEDDPMAWETLQTVKVGNGDRLTLYALNNYGDKVFWVYLFLANQDVLDNPNVLPAGTVIRIPKAPASVVNADNPSSIEKAHAIEALLKQRYD